MCGQYCIEGYCESNKLVIEHSDMSKSSFLTESDTPYRHLILQKAGDTFELVFAPYRASPLLMEYIGAEWNVLKNQGKYWAYALSNVKQAFVVMYKNEKTNWEWVPYRYPDGEVQTHLVGISNSSPLKKKIRKGYAPMGKVLFDKLIKL